MGTIRAALEAKEREFINLYELLETLQKIEGSTNLKEVATFLFKSLYDNRKSAPYFFSLSLNEGMHAENSELPAQILLKTAISGRYVNEDKNVKAYEYFCYGFRRAEIERFLEANGVSLRLANDASNSPPTDAERENARLQQENDRLKAEIQQLKERPVGTKQLNTFLKIIAATCKHGQLDVRTHAKTAGIIRGEAAEIGVDVGETTIENYLKMIPEVIGQKASK
jgi:DNA-binding transcriptional MerR regulator